jgi:hypothetical protein
MFGVTWSPRATPKVLSRLVVLWQGAYSWEARVIANISRAKPNLLLFGRGTATTTKAKSFDVPFHFDAMPWKHMGDKTRHSREIKNDVRPGKTKEQQAPDNDVTWQACALARLLGTKEPVTESRNRQTQNRAFPNDWETVRRWLFGSGCQD